MIKKKIAVLHAQVPFVQGGAELLVSSLTEQLKLRGYDTDLISIPFKWYPSNVLLDSHLIWRMLDLQEANGSKIDLVIALKAPTYMVEHPNKMLWLMHQHRCAYDLQDHVMAGGFNTIPNGQVLKEQVMRMDEMGINECTHKYAISKTVSDRLQRYNGISSEYLYHPPKHVGHYQSGEFGDYFLSIGRLDSIKRVDLLIRALVHCDSHIKAIIGGKGPELENLKALAHQLGVADRVKFLGFVEDQEMLRLYANALGVFFSPVDEDYGYITLEAFLSKKPIITVEDSGGVLEFVQHDKSGFVSQAIAEEIGANMQKLYLNKRMAKSFGEEGWLCVKDIAWDNVIDKLTVSLR